MLVVLTQRDLPDLESSYSYMKTRYWLCQIKLA